MRNPPTCVSCFRLLYRMYMNCISVYIHIYSKHLQLSIGFIQLFLFFTLSAQILLQFVFRCLYKRNKLPNTVWYMEAYYFYTFFTYISFYNSYNWLYSHAYKLQLLLYQFTFQPYVDWQKNKCNNKGIHNI